MHDGCQAPSVYIIDDDTSVRTALSRLMRAAGMHASSFASVRQFMNSDIEDRHACIIADVRLSEASGLDLPGLLAERGRAIPVIFVTAQDTEATRARAHRSGAAAYFRKPVDDQALIDSIRWALSNRVNEE